MRVAIVFSSPSPGTREYKNVWDNCPQRQKLSPGKLVIEGNDWKIYVFDGLEKRHFNGSWVYEKLSREAADIINQHEGSFFAILLHGTDKELNLLRENLQPLGASELLYKWYTSSKGTFFEEYMKPFVSDSPNNAFENLWAKLEKGTPDKAQNEDLNGEIRFLKHLFLNISIFMNSKLNKAKEKKDIGILLEFETFNARIMESLDRYVKIEPTLTKLGIKGIDRVRGAIGGLITIIQEIGKGKDSFSEVLALTNQCLKRAELIHNIFLEVSETTNGR